jgi:DNA-binding NarL/FixJ family response regulator
MAGHHEPIASAAGSVIAWAEGQAMSDDQAVAYALGRTGEVVASPPTDAPRTGGQQRRVLTRREQEVAALIASGRTNREIAETLVITLSTAERHVANILSKLALRSRTEVALWGVEQELTLQGLSGPLTRRKP